MAETTLAKLWKALGFKSLGEFGKEWRTLPDKDKEDLKRGIEDGSMTY